MTLTVNEQEVSLFPEKSVAVYCTLVVVSAGKLVPDGTLDSNVWTPILSLAVGSAQETMRATVPAGTVRTMSKGQFDTTGGEVSPDDVTMRVMGETS